MNILKKVTIPTLLILCTFSIMLMIIVFCNSSKKKLSFFRPPFESNAIEGMPDVNEDLSWSEIYQDGMNFKVGICGSIILNEKDQADIYLYNNETNNVWLKLRILNDVGDILGETGLIKPGEYIKSVSFFEEIKNGQIVKLKIMAYQPNTYYSEGSIVLNTNIQKGG